MKILLVTFGSLGDLHPYIAVGAGLKDRGHQVTIATSEVYRSRVVKEGLNFCPVRPDVSGLIDAPGAMSKAYHPKTGGEYVMREVFLPHLEAGYHDLLEPAREADVLVSHPLAFAVPLLGEALRKPWVSVILQPAVLLSAWDPPSVSGRPELEYFRGLGPGFWKIFWRIGRFVVRRWGAPVTALRAKLGLRPERNPLLDGMYSPYGNQAWFSRVMAQRQPDWPANLEVTGFPFYDKPEAGNGLDPALARFLDAGEPPVVFTLGSSAVFDAGPFYRESAAAARALGVRAVLCIGTDPRNRPEQSDPAIHCTEYASFSELFPRAACVVHQGGSGTTAQALRAARPMIFVPYSHDQPDNARRVGKLGVSRTIARHEYRAARVQAELKALLGDPAVQGRCREVAAVLATEDCVRAACAGIIGAASNRNPAE